MMTAKDVKYIVVLEVGDQTVKFEAPEEGLATALLGIMTTSQVGNNKARVYLEIETKEDK